MIDTAFRLCKPVQSWSFAFMYDAGWSLRRAGGTLFRIAVSLRSSQWRRGASQWRGLEAKRASLAVRPFLDMIISIVNLKS
jgi:hypothetical protein